MKPVVRRIVWLALGGGVAYFAVQGGEYGTSDLVRELRDRGHLRDTIAVLDHVVDSLQRYRKALETDPKLQERIAREEFRMIKPGEVLYIFDDSAGLDRGARSSAP